MASQDAVTPDNGEIYGEPRWPIGLAMAVVIGLTIALRRFGPHRQSVGPGWLVPRAAILLTVLLAAAAVWSTVTLVSDLITGGKVTNSPGTLLAVGGLIWAVNNLVFSLLYWEFDSGGPRARAHRTHRYPDFAFPQQLSPELAPPGWRPKFVDYLYLGLTNSTAFSPTDVMPMAAWAKLTMSAQSLVSLVIIGLVIARAVNIFT